MRPANFPDRTILLRASPAQNSRDGQEQDFDIEPEGPVVNVLQVEADPFFEVDNFIAAADLPEAGEAGFDAQAAAMGKVAEPFDFIHREGTLTDEAHIAVQDIQELGEFIEAVFAEEPANGGDAGVVCNLEDRTAHFVHGFELMFILLGVGYHGAEFIKGKGAAILA